MKYVTYLENISDLSSLKATGIEEVIVAHKNLSRFGTLDTELLLKMIDAVVAEGLRVLIEWDLLMNDGQFQKATKVLSLLPWDKIHAVRVQDPGAIIFFQREYPQKKLQVILETGHHNISSIESYSQICGEQLDRLILSSQLPMASLQAIISKNICPIEILGMGPILLFFTPRSLLSPLLPSSQQLGAKQQINVLAHSEESAHKGFPVLENEHGTFMFNTKDLFLFDMYEKLSSLGINYIRIDLRFGRPFKFIESLFDMTLAPNERYEKCKKDYPYNVSRGYFSVNKTDVLFGKLTNAHIRNKDENYLGDVVEVKKDKYLAVKLRAPQKKLHLGDRLNIRSTVGKNFELEVTQLRNTSLDDIAQAGADQLVLINYKAGIFPKSRMSLLEKNVTTLS